MHFNPRSREGSDNRLEAVRMKTEIFQSTLPRGERPYTGGYGGSVTDFNPRSHEGSDSLIHTVLRSWKHFNPRSHEGSDDFLSFPQNKGKISIHAPTRGATLVRSTSVSPMLISIHAPTRGATTCRDCKRDLYGHFNPRSHEGSDQLSVGIALAH